MLLTLRKKLSICFKLNCFKKIALTIFPLLIHFFIINYCICKLIKVMGLIKKVNQLQTLYIFQYSSYHNNL
jgi:hypothetical protein